MVADASDQQKFQHPLVTMHACFCHIIKKVKTLIVSFLSHNSDQYWNCEFTSCNYYSSPSPRHYFVLFLILCVVLHPQNNSKRSFLLYVVDVMERASTPDYSSN